jgi:hypothetical protein
VVLHVVQNANDGQLAGNTPAHRSGVRMGAEVPVPTAASLAPGGGVPSTPGPIQYKAVGTNIDCFARSLEGGRFNVDIVIEDSSIYSDGQTDPGASRRNDIPTFRSYKLSNAVILKDGQTTQFTAATDKISGEVVRVDVTLTVVK